MSNGWIGVDLDATLARYDHWVSWDTIGEPITPMVERVKQWLLEGKEVKIFTARVAFDSDVCKVTGRAFTKNDVAMVIQDWCHHHIGEPLEVTATKDFRMIELWDDRAVQVEPNTGEPVTYWTTRV